MPAVQSARSRSTSRDTGLCGCDQHWRMRRGSVTRRAGLMSSPFAYTLHTVSVATVMVASRPHRRTLLPASHANKVESTDRCRASTGNVPGYDPSQKCPFQRGGGVRAPTDGSLGRGHVEVTNWSRYPGAVRYQIGSAVFAGLAVVTNRHADGHTASCYAMPPHDNELIH